MGSYTSIFLSFVFFSSLCLPFCSWKTFLHFFSTRPLFFSLHSHSLTSPFDYNKESKSNLSLAWYISRIHSCSRSFIAPTWTELLVRTNLLARCSEHSEGHTHSSNTESARGRRHEIKKTITYMQEMMGVSRRWWADLWGHIRESFVEKVTFGLNIKLCWRCRGVEHKRQGACGRMDLQAEGAAGAKAWRREAPEHWNIWK